MSAEQKMMSNTSPAKIMTPGPSNVSGTVTVNSIMSPAQTLNQQIRALHGPVAILWDIENCPVPSDVRPEDVAGNIRMALRVHPVIKGVVTMFSAYGDFNAFPRRLREGCQRTGVKLVDVPNGRKDAADKAILVDMFLFALDNPPPSSILLISGDVDFAPALHILGQRGYTVILVIPAGVGVSSALSNAGRFVWDWPSVARGEGFVPPKSYIPRAPDLAGYLMGCHLMDSLDGQNEEESIVYRGNSQSEYSAMANINQVYCFDSSHVSREVSRTTHSMSEFSNSNLISGPYVPSSRAQSLLSGINEVPVGDRPGVQENTWSVQTGDIEGLKAQLVRLIETSGGSVPLVRVPAEYLKMYGRPLYVAAYGVCKLVNLIKKMAETLIVEGKGHKKVLCLRNSIDKAEKAGPSTPILLRKDRNGKGAQEESVDIGVCPNLGCSSDDYSDDEKACALDETNMDPELWIAYEYDDCLETFRKEVQELLVCHSFQVRLSKFEELYKWRFKKTLDFQNFGVNGLEELIKKVRDVVKLREVELCDVESRDVQRSKEKKVKVLVPSCFSG